MEQIVVVPVLFFELRECHRHEKHTDDRQMGSLSVRAFFIYLCVAWSEHISATQSRPAHTAMLMRNAAVPIVWHGGLLLTPSCRCIQHSTAGPPPGKQMAGNNTVTHPEHWHPGPGLCHALCYLSACIASEIPPSYPCRATTRLGDIHEWNWLDSWASLAKHTLPFYNESICLRLFKWPSRVWWVGVISG